jgi:polar amino acid transport system substrate-binding protein
MRWRHRAGLLLLLCPLLQASPLRFVGSDFPGVVAPGTPQLRGVAADIIRTLCQREQLACSIQLLPWPRAQAMLQNGQADVLIGPYRTAARAASMRFSRYPIYIDTLYWYRRTEQAIQWDGRFDSLVGLRLGVTRGWTLGQRFEEAKPRLEIDNADTLLQSMLKLQRKRLDLVASNDRNARHTLAQLGRSDIVPILPAISQQGGYMGYALHALDKPALQRFEQALVHLAESGELARLSQEQGLAYPGKNTNWPDYLRQLP